MNKIKKCDILIIILFILGTFSMGMHHEPWTDEAQAWLIARDVSIKEIVFNVERYECGGILWYLIIKAFIFLGLEYKYFFVISIIISLLGLIIFFSKEKIPKYIKYILPFSYYIFYQYTIVSRNYCLMFLAFSILLFTYPNRLKNIYSYIINLIFFSLISLHGMVISGILALLLGLEIIKQKKYKNLFCFVPIVIIWIIEVIILFPRSDLFINLNVLYNPLLVFQTMLESIFIFKNENISNSQIFQNIITFLFFLYITIISGLSKENKDFVILEIVMFFFFIFIRALEHHYGIFFLIVWFGIILNYDSINKNKKHFKKVLFISILLYFIFSIQACYNDWNKNYSGAKEISEYIKKEIKYDENNIWGIDYYTTAILPYFDENIFIERNETYYEWSINNKWYYNYCRLEKKECFDAFQNMIIDSKVKYIIIDNRYNKKKYIVNQMIVNSGLYELVYENKGFIFYKNFYKGVEGFLLYKKIEK